MKLENIKISYEKLGDELSRKIFIERLNHSISQEETYIERLLDCSVRKNDSWIEFRKTMDEFESGSVVLFGNGIWGQTLVDEFSDYNWKAIIDNKPGAETYNGIKLCKADSFLSDYNNEKIVISSYKNRQSMIDQCKSHGVPDENIVDAASVIYDLTEGIIYFDDSVPIKLREGVLIDGGCFDGSDTLRYLVKFKGSSLCFEPDSNNISKIKSKLSSVDESRYRIINKALWSKKGSISFQADGNNASRIDEDCTSEITVETISIDEAAGDSVVSMIKMDIEGAEAEALKGAKKIIKRDKPVLAISIYHKPEDILELPGLISEIYDGYKFYLRHYSLSWYDTVLYAISE